jgi:protein SCO1/2
MESELEPNANRRAALGALLAFPLTCTLFQPRLLAAAEKTPGSGAVVNAHGGPILPPVPVPNVRVQLTDGRHIRLQELLRNKSTALQTVFTRCTTTCPMQGAIFQRVQRLFTDQVQRGAQMISLSIDPAEDSPTALQEWLARFEAREGWFGAVPRPEDLPLLRAFLGNSTDSLTSHATQVQIIDRAGQLVWRTNELPSPQSVTRLLRSL